MGEWRYNSTILDLLMVGSEWEDIKMDLKEEGGCGLN
jgi:hypothetical protein